MNPSPTRNRTQKIARLMVAVLCATVLLTGCGDGDENFVITSPLVDRGSDGPGITENPNPHARGNAANGQTVFRFETFGTEGFWTDAMRLPQGLRNQNVTLLKALQLGLNVDIDAVDAQTKAVLMNEFQTDLSPLNAPSLNSYETLVTLINDNAVIGLVPVKTTNNGEPVDIENGDKLGVSCTVCHTITDGSAFSLPNGGSVGRRVDGPSPHNFDFGSTIAAADNSRAYFPALQLELTALRGHRIGRAPVGLTDSSSEAEVDAYLTNKAFYPVGTFDDSIDGNGDPQHIQSLFRTDLSAPYATEGAISRLDNFSNLVYTALLDPTVITTPGGRAFMHKFGLAAGDEIVERYINVLEATNVTGYPYIDAELHPNPGSEEAPLGIRVDNTKLIDMNAYLDSLPAPAGEPIAPDVRERARNTFRQNCTACHNVDQGMFVPPTIIPMKTMFPTDNPINLGDREPPLNPILDSPGIFDDKMAVINASARGLIRGIALPLLLDLARKPNFLHDSTVASLDALLNPARGANEPHNFYIADQRERAELVQYLRSLDTSSR